MHIISHLVMDNQQYLAKSVNGSRPNRGTFTYGNQSGSTSHAYSSMVEEQQGESMVFVSSDPGACIRDWQTGEAIVIASLWCHEIGEQVIQNPDLQDELDVGGKKRELSIFQLGLRFIRRCLALNIERLPTFNLRLSNLVLAPVLPRIPASQKRQ